MAGKKAERDRLRREAAVARAEFHEWMSVCEKVMDGDAEGVAPLLSAARVRYIPPHELWTVDGEPVDLFSFACCHVKEAGGDFIALRIAQILIDEAKMDAAFDLKARRCGVGQFSLLHFAVMSKQPSVIEAVLPYVDPLAENSRGETAATFAQNGGYPDLAILIENHLTQLERRELDATTPAGAPSAGTGEEARRRRINPFAK